MFYYATCGGELLIQIQFTVMRCVQHGVRVHSQKTSEKMGKSYSTGLIGQREFQVRNLQSTIKE
jgi:hypothetical protein